MTLRSLSNCFRFQDSQIGAHGGNGANEKLVISPNRRTNRIVVPGHVSEVEFQNDTKVTDVDPSQITGRGANWNRYYIRVIKRRNITHSAISTYDVHPKRVREI